MVKESGGKKSSPARGKLSGDEKSPDTAGGIKAGAANDDALPTPEEINALAQPVFNFKASSRYARVRSFLERLASRPPQVLLLEGGDAEERMAAAHYWATLLNCHAMHPQKRTSPQPPQSESLSLLPGISAPAQETPHDIPITEPTETPCLECPECIRLITHMHRDVFFLDGLAGSIKMDDVRQVRSVLGEPPREALKRVVIFREAQSFVEAAANALLKSLEEPSPGTSFVMLAPQRERLLPTLVSRSVVLTLPWPSPLEEETPEHLIPWEASLCAFLQSGRGWFDKTGLKGALSPLLANEIINMCKRALVISLTGGQTAKAEGLQAFFARLPEKRLRIIDEMLAECQDSLNYAVNPTLVMEWLGSKLFLLIPRR